MTEQNNTTTSTNNIPSPSSNGKVKINMTGGSGGFSFDQFNAAIGKEEVPDMPIEAKDEMDGSGELLDDPIEATEEPRFNIENDKNIEEEVSEEGKEEIEEEVSEETEEPKLEDLGKDIKKGGVKAFTKDGKALTLPPDLEIEQVIDGETHKINLREHLNVVAGELTVQSRLSKIGSFQEHLKKEREELTKVHKKFNDDIETLVGFAKEGKPDLAICYLAEINGMSPIEMKKKFLQAIVQEATKFEGKSEIEIENYYLNLERQWRDRKEQQRKQREEEENKTKSFIEHVTSELKKENISPDEFTSATQELADSNQLEGLTQERRLDAIIEHALLTKHKGMAKSALELVDPKLVNNKQLFELLLENTHPNKFTVEEMADVVSGYLGKARTQIASSLSKKVSVPQIQTKPEKQNGGGKKQKTYTSLAAMQRAFGL